MVKQIRILLLTLFTIILFTNSIYAQPPQIITPDNGYTVRPAAPLFIKQNTATEFHAHIINTTDGVPITESVGCYFHFYSLDGNHLAEVYDETPSHMFDYVFDLSAGNYSENGEHDWIMQCNSSSAGGESFGSSLVTPTGFEPPTAGEGDLLLSIVLILLVATLMFFIAAMWIKNIPFKVFFGGMSLTFLIATLGLGVTMLQSILGQFSGVVSGFGGFYRILIILFSVSVIGLIFYLLVVAVKVYNMKKGVTGD